MSPQEIGALRFALYLWRRRLEHLGALREPGMYSLAYLRHMYATDDVSDDALNVQRWISRRAAQS